MVRTTITLGEEELEELKRLAAQQDRSISWLLRQAFRLSKARLERNEPYAVGFDRIWGESDAPSGAPECGRQMM